MRQLPAWAWLLVAAGFAATASFMALGWLKNQSKGPVPQAVAKVNVVVAKGEIDALAELTPDKLKLETWAQSTRPKGTFGSIQEVVGLGTYYPLTEGELILQNKTFKGPPGLSARIEPNHRAMTVKVDEASGVAGFLNPGRDLVDVVVTMDKGPFEKRPVSKLIIQKRKVLGTGQKIENRPGDKPQVVPTATLEVTPEEGEQLALASQEGRISLVLRGHEDQELVYTPGVKAQEFFSQFGGGTPSGKDAPASVPRRTVEVIRGLERNAANF